MIKQYQNFIVPRYLNSLKTYFEILIYKKAVF